MARWLSCTAAVAVSLAAGLAALPSPASAQAEAPMAVLSRLGLATEQVGRVTAHFAAADRARARELAVLVESAAAMFDAELGLSFPLQLAALGPDDWFADIPGIPYAIPWPAMNDRLLVVPSSLTTGLLVEGRSPVAGRRLVDFVTLHEYGHVAAKEYYRAGDTADYIPVHWFRELVATYFAYDYIASVDPAWARAARQEWAAEVAAFTPAVISLDWRFMGSLGGRELARTYEWYQLMLNLRAAELHDAHGTRLLIELRRLPWGHAQEWTTDSVLGELDGLTPAFATWARGFGAKP